MIEISPFSLLITVGLSFAIGGLCGVGLAVHFFIDGAGK